MSELFKMLIIEDHPIVRNSLASYFTGTGRWNVIETAVNIEEAKKVFNETSIDLLLLDLQLESGWSLDIIPYLKNSGIQKMPVLAVYSSFDDYKHVRAALSMGVRVYISKRRDEKQLEEALLQAMEGKTVIDNQIKMKIQTLSDQCDLLTNRESEILLMVKNGLSNKEIASRLKINYRTVENILSCVYDKTGIRSRAELLK